MVGSQTVAIHTFGCGYRWEGVKGKKSERAMGGDLLKEGGTVTCTALRVVVVVLDDTLKKESSGYKGQQVATTGLSTGSDDWSVNK